MKDEYTNPKCLGICVQMLSSGIDNDCVGGAVVPSASDGEAHSHAPPGHTRLL